MDKQVLFETAIKYRNSGRDVIPDHPTKKYPFGIEGWEQKNFSEEEFSEYILNKGWGIGIRNQEGLDFDDHGAPGDNEVYGNWKKLVNTISPGLVDRLLIEKTQHGGFHLAWKCSVIEGNQKLAKRLPTEDELQKDPKVREICLIETRGTGGQFVVSPTPGYTLLQGDWCKLPEITKEERSLLLRCAKSLNLLPDTTTEDFIPADNNSKGDRPGDLFNKEGASESLDLLKQEGWTTVYEHEGTIFLRRPGKNVGISATFGYKKPGLFYNFTSNGYPFEPNKAYSPFAILSLLKYNGDYKSAAAYLANRYGLHNSQKFNFSTHFTDLSNAEAIAKLFGSIVRFDHRRNRWLVWKGHSWKHDNDGSINRLAIDSVRNLYRKAEQIEDLKQRNELAKWAIASENRQRLDSAIAIAKNILPIADSGDGWDSDQMLLSCPNGIVELTSGKLRDGKPEDRITMCTRTEFDSAAQCPRWDKFINEIFEENDVLIHYIQKALGYSLTGLTTEQCAFFGLGKGSNGKSVLFTTLRNILGDYAHSAPASLFQRNITNTSSNDVAAIENKRFLLSAETLSATRLNEQRLKAWTGGDMETARFLYSEFFSFYPTCKPWLFLNHAPIIEDDSHAFWRRVRLIPFNRKFEGKEVDAKLTEKLHAEHKGILAWLVRGCLLWQAEGLAPTPEIVLTATSDYRSDNDALYEFICDSCGEHVDRGVKVSQIYLAYTKWADAQGQKNKDVLSLSAFGRRMTDKYKKIRAKTGYFYRGIYLKEDEAGVHFDPIVSHEVNTTPSNANTISSNSSRKRSTKNDPQVFTQPQKKNVSVHQENSMSSYAETKTSPVDKNNSLKIKNPFTHLWEDSGLSE